MRHVGVAVGAGIADPKRIARAAGEKVGLRGIRAQRLWLELLAVVGVIDAADPYVQRDAAAWLPSKVSATKYHSPNTKAVDVASMTSET